MSNIQRWECTSSLHRTSIARTTHCMARIRPMTASYCRSSSRIWEHGIEVAVVSWWGQRDKDYATDTQGVNTDEVMANLLKVAAAPSPYLVCTSTPRL